MKDETIMRLALLATGTILLVVYAFTGANGALVSAGASLIGAGAGIVRERREKEGEAEPDSGSAHGKGI